MKIDHSTKPPRPTLDKKELTAVNLAASVLNGLAAITDDASGDLDSAATTLGDVARRYAPVEKGKAAKD